ncbi:MAG: diphosphomevalonate decarboxylase [Anaerolineaceae bacterium]|nr:diphosphomevalonate decarboxylase [Anaerolineaceae bacterium]
MKTHTATAIAHPNIAFIKYWGNRNTALRLPHTNSISANLRDLHTCTKVTFRDDLTADTLHINDQPAEDGALKRVSLFLDLVRTLAGINSNAEVISSNNFPMGAGIASSAAAFSALALAGSAATGLSLDEKALSRLARRGSGSASRSIPAGYVEWQAGSDDADSYAVSIADENHWALADCVAIINASHKIIGSSLGHTIADTSPFQEVRLQTAPQRLDECRQAILQKDFERLATVTELDSTMMHSVMMTSNPALFYWEPASISVMKEIPLLRAKGLAVCYTLDAGANVHVFCEASSKQKVHKLLAEFPGVQSVIDSEVGGPARLV